MNGKLVSNIAAGFRAAGYYSEIFNAVNVASGVYYCKLEYRNSDKSFEKVMKMAVVK